MATKRKAVVIKNVSEQDAQQALKNYADASLKFDKKEAEMNIEINKVKEKFQKDLTDHEAIKNAAFEDLQSFAMNNRDKWGERKSIDWVQGTLGFRTGQFKVAQKTGFTWASILGLAMSKLKPFIRTKSEIDKEALIANRTDKKLIKKMELCGMEIKQDETFFVDLKELELSN